MKVKQNNSKIVCGCQLWWVEHLKALFKQWKRSINQKAVLILLFAMFPVVSSFLKLCNICLLVEFPSCLIVFLANTFLADNECVWKEMGIRPHVGDSLINLVCIASSSAWWASSDCMAAEHSRASMVRIRCSPQPGKKHTDTAEPVSCLLWVSFESCSSSRTNHLHPRIQEYIYKNTGCVWY